MRLNKFIADCGISSRRKADDLIRSGKIKVNGEKITEMGYQLHANDVVKYDNKTIKLPNQFVYYKLHKPKGYVTTVSDEKSRKTVIDLMRGIKKRIYPVGRLDYDTEGLLLLTNDGDLTNKIMHPTNKIEKTYIAVIDSNITNAELERIKQGIDIGGYTTAKCNAIILEQDKNTARIEIAITEGKNRQVKKMFEAIGKNITFLKRTKIGEISLGGLSRGEYKELTQKEMDYIQQIKMN